MTSLYNIGTLLRYYPEADSNEHYTAVVARNSIIQVKPVARNKDGRRDVRSVESIEKWLATLPGSPSIDQLKIEEPKNRFNTSQVYLLRSSVGWNIPKTFHQGVKWAVYIYRMMYEANKELCNRDDIRDAYNHLVEVLTSYQDVITSDYMRIDYHNGIKIENSSFLPKGSIAINPFPTYKLPYYKMPEYLAILDAYHPLYELIKADVIPYMDRQYEIINYTRDLKFATKMMRSSERRILSMQEKIKNLSHIHGIMKARAEAATAILNRTA